MSDCRAPCLGEHRETLSGCDDEHALQELRRAWGHPAHQEDTDWIRQDWSTFRAVTLREVRRRGLVVPHDTLILLRDYGINTEGIS